MMSKCLKCSITILDPTDICPLCHCVLEAGEEKEDSYPDIRLKGRKLELISRILLFLSIVVGGLSVILNYTYPTKVWWCALVVGGLVLLQLFMFFVIVNERAGYRSKYLTGMTCAAIYMVLVDYVFGFTRWSVDYVIPTVFLAMDLSIIAVMFVNIRNWQSYLLFQILMILCSGVWVILCFLEWIRRPFMSYLVFGLSCVLFLASVIIGGRRASNELKRRFHVM